jgi:site-specific DNA-methyltransferase (adenine-specific)
MNLNRIYQGDSRNLREIEDECVHLTVTSPPYYVGKGYEGYLPTLESYFKMLEGVFQEVVRVTVPGGKIIINIGDIAVGSKYNGGFPQEVMIIPRLVDSLINLDTYLYARIVWEKDDPWANSSHVTFHDKVQHAEYRILPAWEYVFVFRKGKTARQDKSSSDGRWIDKKDWKKYVHGVWKIRSVQNNKLHEAMFPEKFVKFCVKAYSFPGDVVFDPFMGSGTTAVAAKKLERYYLGYELDHEYIEKAENRLAGISECFIEPQREYKDKTANKRECQETIF